MGRRTVAKPEAMIVRRSRQKKAKQKKKIEQEFFFFIVKLQNATYTKQNFVSSTRSGVTRVVKPPTKASRPKSSVHKL